VDLSIGLLADQGVVPFTGKSRLATDPSTGVTQT
jgi:hypothetical protein